MKKLPFPVGAMYRVSLLFRETYPYKLSGKARPIPGFHGLSEGKKKHIWEPCICFWLSRLSWNAYPSFPGKSDQFSGFPGKTISGFLQSQEFPGFQTCSLGPDAKREGEATVTLTLPVFTSFVSVFCEGK